MSAEPAGQHSHHHTCKQERASTDSGLAFDGRAQGSSRAPAYTTSSASATICIRFSLGKYHNCPCSASASAASGNFCATSNSRLRACDRRYVTSDLLTPATGSHSCQGLLSRYHARARPGRESFLVLLCGITG